MAISLNKDRNINLTNTGPLLKNIKIGLSWDVRITDGCWRRLKTDHLERLVPIEY